MANVIGTVVKIGINVPVEKSEKNGGGTYQGWKLIYEDEKGEVKTIAKHMNSLKYASALKNGLEALKPGDSFVLEQEKEGDFWNPKNVYKSDGQAQKSTSNVQQSANSKAPLAAASTYATKEERAQTQVYIVRQSSLTAALKVLELRGTKKIEVNDIITLAEYFEEFVLGKYKVVTASLDATSESLEDMDDDLPF